MRYNATNFLEKNKDPLNDSAVAVLKHCKNNQLLVDIWNDYQTQEEAAMAAKAGIGASNVFSALAFLRISSAKSKQIQGGNLNFFTNYFKYERKDLCLILILIQREFSPNFWTKINVSESFYEVIC